MPRRSHRRTEEEDDGDDSDDDRDSWERSSESGESEEGENEEVEISIEDIANFTVDFEHLVGQPVFSPRSVEACRAVGVDPYELLPDIQDDYEELADQVYTLVP